MKHTWVTSLSVLCVVGAGSAAVLANTTVFKSTGRAVGSVTVDAASTVPTGSEPVVPAVETSSTPDGAQTYAVGSSGTAQLANAHGVITVTSALAAAGWTVQSVSAPGDWVVVEFLSADQRVAFNAFLVNGQIEVSVDTSAPDQPFQPRNPQQPGAVGTAVVAEDGNVTDTALTLPPSDDDDDDGGDSDD